MRMLLSLIVIIYLIGVGVCAFADDSIQMEQRFRLGSCVKRLPGLAWRARLARKGASKR